MPQDEYINPCKVLADNLPGIVYRVFLRENNRIQFANNAAPAITGYSDAELTEGQVCGIEQIMPPEDRDKVFSVVSRAVAEKRPFTVEYRIKHKDGSIRYLLEEGVPSFGPDGEPLYIDGVIFDITGRRLVEKEKERLLKGVTSSKEGIAFTDRDDRFMYVNAAHARIYGYTPEEMEGKTWRDLTPPELIETAEQRMADTLKKKGAGEFSAESPALRKDGTTIPTEITATALWDDEGNYDGHVCIVRDISERKNLERQRADFFAMVTHDIKSPLAALLGYSELISKSAKEKADKEISDMADNLTRSGKKLLRLVGDFLTTASLESGGIQLRISKEDMAALLRGVRDDFEPLARKKGISLKLDIADGLPRVTMDKKQVERAVGNLLQNAFNHTPRGGEVILGSEAFSCEGAGCVVVRVSDSGCGIPYADHDKIFDKYYRSTRTVEKGIKGAGLGLAIVKAVAEAHGGKVEMKSEEGKGSTFSIILPV